MKIRIVFTGKTENAHLKELLGDYLTRIRRYVTTEIIEIPSLKNASSLSPAEQSRKEADLIRNQLNQGDFVVLLDERGLEVGSREFAGFLDRRFHAGGKSIVFVVGGPYGFDPSLKKEAGQLLSLSRMTLPHQLVRLFLAEQLYRAFTILKGESYHHD